MTRTIPLAMLAAMALPAIAAAQQAPAPPAWQQGRPPEMANSTLAPHALPPTVTPPDRLPVAQLRVPPGFQVELWAHGMPGIRMMTRAEDGTIFAGTRVIGRVYWIREQGGQRQTGVFAQGLTQPNGVAMRGNALYVAAIDKILRFDNATANLSSPTPTDITSAFDIADDAHHGWRHIAFGPDGRLYIPRGVPCNICEADGDKYALIASFNPDGSGKRIEARGVRNSVGFDFHPTTGKLWFTNHARDWAGNDNPSDSLHVAIRAGEHHGFPWCMAGFQDPAIPSTRVCAEFPPPAVILGPHVAPIGTHFYTGTAFPEQYRNALFIAHRGSWNREKLAGYEIVTVRDVEGRLVKEPFLTGFRDDANQRFLGRPAGLLTLPDGSMLMTDEQNGAIYRISYRR
jgi:glucose/arabinose dehydrogenase